MTEFRAMSTTWRRILLALPAAAVLFLVTSFTLPPLLGGVCFEGGTRLGFPAAFFYQCRGAILPGGGQNVEPPQVLPGPVAFDVGFWFIIALGLIHLSRPLARRSSLRGAT